VIAFQIPEEPLAGPSIDWYGLSPLLVLLGGASRCCCSRR
jgi:hypothetical protein